jgi:N-acetylglucosaminyldiphosphoundecaprenol N-acetyl-beta-D-mannosaminyltransferase
MRETQRLRIFGVLIDVLDMQGSIERCTELIEAGVPAQHVSLNAGKVVLMEDTPGLRDLVAACDIVNADGQAVVWAARACGIRLPERVAGIDLMAELLSRAEERGWPVFFLGATQDSLEAFISKVRKLHPGLRIAGSRNGYFDDDEAVAREVAGSGARVLFVGISSPRKEEFLGRVLPTMGPVFAMGVGGSFDVWAGRTARAPKWMQRSGLEWLYRFIQEPRRMWKRYLIGNARFVALTVRERRQHRRAPSPPG